MGIYDNINKSAYRGPSLAGDPATNANQNAMAYGELSNMMTNNMNFTGQNTRSPGATGPLPPSSSPGSLDEYNRQSARPAPAMGTQGGRGLGMTMPGYVDYNKGYSGGGAYNARTSGPSWNPQGPRPELQLQKIGALPELQLPEYAAPEADPDRIMQLKQSAMRPGMRGLEQSFQQGRLNMDYMSSPTSQKEYIRGLLGGMSEGIEKIAGQAGQQAQEQFNTERQEQISQYDKKYGLKQRQVETNYRQAIDKILKNVGIKNDQAKLNWNSATDEYFTAGKATQGSGSGGSGGFTQTDQGNFYKGQLVPPGYSFEEWDKMDDSERAYESFKYQRQGRMSAMDQAKNQYAYTVTGTGKYGLPTYGYKSLYEMGAGR